MSKIFISHSSANNAHALAVSMWLADQGWAEYFLDITPSRGLAPGERWQEALRSATSRCEAVLFLISPAWQASRWCLAEFLLAKQLGKTIFGIMIESTPLESLPKEMTADWQLCDLVQGTSRMHFRVSQEPIVPESDVSFSEDGLSRLRIGLQRAGLDPDTFPWPPQSDPSRAPYRGLRALDSEDAAVFFGRESAIVRALDTLRGVRERGVEALFVVLGASGAGKSSFLRAGLWPRLLRNDGHFLPLPIIRPERAVISGTAGLAASLEAGFQARGSPRSRATIGRIVQEPGGFGRLIGELQVLAASPIEPDAAPVVVISIDQGEELFSADGGVESSRFLDLLASALSVPTDGSSAPVAPRLRALAIVAIRSDSYERLQSAPQLAKVAPYLFSLPPVASTEYKAVIEGPARRHTEADRKLTVDPALTERLINDAQGADALPQLAFTLERLFVEHGGAGELLLGNYESMGGVRGSIEAAIEAAFADPGREPAVPADRAVRERILHAAFVPWLARIDPDSAEPKRRVASWQEISAEAHPLIERLVEQRLLLRDWRKQQDGQGGIVVEVAHEALLRQWPMLTAWLDSDADALKQLDATRRAALEWQGNAHGEAWLVHAGERLAAAERFGLREDFARLLGEEGAEYLRVCRRREDGIQAEQLMQVQRVARAQRRVSLLLGAIAIVLVAAGSWLAVETRAVARQTSLVLAAEAERANDAGLHDRAMRFALLAMTDGWLSPSVPAAQVELARAAHASGQRARMDHDDQVGWVALSGDGRRLITASLDRTARVWDIESGRELARFQHEDKARLGEISPDGSRALTYADDKAARVWHIASGRETAKLQHDGELSAATFFDDGRRVATASSDKTARIWDAVTGKELARLRHENSVASVAVCGNRIATASYDHTARIWDAVSGTELVRVQHADGLWGAEFSSDCRRVVSRAGNVARVWNVADGKELAAFEHGDRVSDASFSADGARVVTASFDKTARIWDVASGKELLTMPSFEGQTVQSARFSSDDRLVVTASGDKARVWDSASGRLLLQFAHESSVAKVRFSLDGKHVVSCSSDHTARIWDALTDKRRSVHLQRVEGESVSPVALSHDGRLIVTTGANTQVWNSSDGSKHADLGPGEVSSARFSVDNDRIVTTSPEHGARIWNAKTGAEIAHLPNEGGVAFASLNYDGTRVATVSGTHTASVWDVASSKMLSQVKHEREVSEAILNADGTRLVTTSFDRTARIWDAGTGRELARLSHHNEVLGASFDAKGQRLVTATSPDGLLGQLQVWDVRSGKEISRVFDPSPVWSAHFSIDGQWVVASAVQIASIWNAASGNGVASVPNESEPLETTAVTLTTDGQHLVVATGDRISFWETRWLAGLHGDQLKQAVCREKLVGARRLLAEDVRVAPILGGRTGELVCNEVML